MTAEMTDRAVLMRQSTNPKELTDGKASRIGLSKESSAKRNMNKVDIDHKVLRVWKKNKVIKDYSSSTKANLSEVQELILAKEKMRIFKL